MVKICSPALIYIIFSLTQIIVDTIKGLYNTAFFKFIVSILITILLDALCKGGMGIISWIIVFIPFIFMTVIVSILLYIFGLDVATGKLDLKCEHQKQDSNYTGNLIYSSTPNPKTNNQSNINNNSSVPNYSSDPQYESFITN
jgi:predicted membrane protein